MLLEEVSYLHEQFHVGRRRIDDVLPRPLTVGIHRDDEHEVDDGEGDDERDDGIDEHRHVDDLIPNRELADVDTPSEEDPDDRTDQPLRERADQRGERRPHDEGHRKVDDVAAQHECAKSLKHDSP